MIKSNSIYNKITKILILNYALLWGAENLKIKGLRVTLRSKKIVKKTSITSNGQKGGV